MQQAIDTLRQVMPERGKDSKLTEDARAIITFIDVKPYHIDEKRYVILADREEQSVDRIRGVFFKELGRKKAARDFSGPAVDIPAFIDFRISRRDPEVFDNQALNRGFGYHVLSDMSGSMSSIFPAVGHAMKMLHDALDFPFVQGDFWGFRGSDDVSYNQKTKRAYGGNEVWLYRYHKDCKGFEGKAQVVTNTGAKIQVAVGCGGITPMNSALRVAVRHVDKNVPRGMAKRLYLLTDGAPFQFRTDGKQISDKFLKQFVAREIKWARSHGIEVYTLIIGNAGISDNDAKFMFGERKFWKRSSSKAGEHDSVDLVLTKMIVQNFSRYLRAR